MDILGKIGQLYTFLLLVVLFLGAGLAVWAVISSIMNKKDIIKDKINTKMETIKKYNINGGSNMKSNGFIKLAVFAFVGIIISMAILSFLPTITNNNMNNMNTNGMYSQSNMMNQSSMGMTGSNMQSNAMQGMSNAGIQGMTSSGTQGYMSNQSVDTYSIQQQLMNIQQQINQLQNQVNSLTNNSSNMNNQNSSGSMNSNSGSMNSNGGSSSGSMSMPMM